METVFGLLGIVLFVASVVSLAAAITWVVVKVSPAEKPPKPKTESGEPAN